MQGILGTENLTVTYDKGTPKEFTALKSVSFYAEPGEFVIVFGPSGCGKSTLLYMLSCIERHISGGEAWVNGKDIVHMQGDDLLDIHRHDIGMIFQAYNLIGTLNVISNVTLPLLAMGIPDSQRPERAMALLERFGVAHLAKRYPSELSGGQQQRVAIARALVTNPDIIFADEPTGNLDAASTEIVMKQLLNLRSQDKKTILMVTHDPTFLHYADRVVWLKDGNLTKVDVQKGTKEFASALSDSEEKENKETPTLSLETKEKQDELIFGTSPFDKEMKEELSFEEMEKASIVPKFAQYVRKEPKNVLTKRFERILFEIAIGKLLKKEALLLFKKPTIDGGLGIEHSKVISILVEFDELFELREWLGKYPPKHRLDPLSMVHITRFLLGSLFGILSTSQDVRLRKDLSLYLSEEIKGTELLETLGNPIEQGGLGFSGVVLDHIVEKANLIRDLIPKEVTI